MTDFNRIIREAAGFVTEGTTSSTEAARGADGRFARDLDAEMNQAIRRAAGHEEGPAPASSEDPDERAWEEAERPIRSRIEDAARAAGFIDPSDAVDRLRHKLPMDADGLPEPQALRVAVREMAGRSPHLVDQSRPLDVGSGDGGVRRSPPPPVDMNEWIRESVWERKMRRAMEEGWKD